MRYTFVILLHALGRLRLAPRAATCSGIASFLFLYNTAFEAYEEQENNNNGGKGLAP